MARSLFLYTTKPSPSKDGLFPYEPLDYILEFDQFWEIEDFVKQITHTRERTPSYKTYLGVDAAKSLVKKYTELLSEANVNLTYDIAKKHYHALGVLSVIVRRMKVGEFLMFTAEDE